MDQNSKMLYFATSMWIKISNIIVITGSWRALLEGIYNSLSIAMAYFEAGIIDIL